MLLGTYLIGSTLIPAESPTHESVILTLGIIRLISVGDSFVGDSA